MQVFPNSRIRAVVSTALLVMLWISVAVGAVITRRYVTTVARARAAAERQDLFIVCVAAEKYAEDNGAPAASLDQLVTERYLFAVPASPTTHQKYSILSCFPQEADPIETLPPTGNPRVGSARLAAERLK